MSSLSEVINSTDRAYDFIKKRIMEGTFKPSEKLVESQLAKDIGVSRNTLKNALLLLQKENLIDIEKHKGAKVKAFTLDEVKNYLEIREVLEGVIAKSAAVHISNSELDELESILNQMEAFIKQERFDDYSNLNKKFHSVIYQSSKNKQAVDMVLVIKTQLIRYHFRTILVPGRNHSSLQEHKNIFEALKNRNPQEAEASIKTHISHVRRTIEDYYQFLI